MPQEFRRWSPSRPDPIQILRQRGALPGMGAIRKLAGSLAGRATPARPRRCARSPTSAAARELREVRGDIRRDFAALNRLSSTRAAPPPPRSPRPSPRSTRRPSWRALGADGLREFAERYAGRTEVAQKVKVLDFEGVFVSGRRALAQVVYRLSPARPSGHFVARAPATWTVTLAHEDGRWRFVQGLET